MIQRQAKCDTLPTSPLLSYWTKDADTKARPRFVKPLSPMASQAVVLAEGVWSGVTFLWEALGRMTRGGVWLTGAFRSNAEAQMGTEVVLSVQPSSSEK